MPRKTQIFREFDRSGSFSSIQIVYHRVIFESPANIQRQEDVSELETCIIEETIVDIGYQAIELNV